MPDYMLAFVIAAGMALLVTPGVIWLAKKTGALDKPDARKVHKNPIPRIGGLGIYLAFMAAMAAVLLMVEVDAEVRQEITGLMVGGSLIVALGLVDDYTNLPAKVKLLGQIVAACVLVLGFDVRIDFITDPFGDYLFLEFLAVPATIFWIVGLTNTVNLIDGLDGRFANMGRSAEIRLARREADDVGALGFHFLGFGGDRQGDARLAAGGALAQYPALAHGGLIPVKT